MTLVCNIAYLPVETQATMSGTPSSSKSSTSMNTSSLSTALIANGVSKMVILSGTAEVVVAGLRPMIPTCKNASQTVYPFVV